ncbi:cysteine-rich CWC family protein [Sinobacterium norvegicum]|uniref:cysteine-rich CWC family protein n=1 Tax=Sinobacterium norvegicum TaxID=1641715 RepID=UPI001F46936C|nr:cysteine-rich CWC family protein [Sinobacterium norvegicum]
MDNLCPLCQQNNACGAASNSEQTPCWCMFQAIDNDKLRRAHPELTDAQCLCQRCAANFSKPLQPSQSEQNTLGIDVGSGDNTNGSTKQQS